MIKTYKNWLNESKSPSQFFKTREEIQEWFAFVLQIGSHHYVINDDLTVSTPQDLNIAFCGLNRLPIQFKHIGGNTHFNNNKLSSLKGAPSYVDGDFFCNNNNLTSLEFCPKVSGTIYVGVNDLTSLVFAPTYVNLSFYENPCTEIYKRLGFTSEAHVEALKTLDPNPKETLERLKLVYPDRYEDVLKVSRELRIIMGEEGEDLTSAYNNSKSRGDDFY